MCDKPVAMSRCNIFTYVHIFSPCHVHHFNISIPLSGSTDIPNGSQSMGSRPSPCAALQLPDRLHPRNVLLTTEPEGISGYLRDTSGLSRFQRETAWPAVLLVSLGIVHGLLWISELLHVTEDGAKLFNRLISNSDCWIFLRCLRLSRHVLSK